MMKITNLNEIQNISQPKLKAHIKKTVQQWKDEYLIEDLNEIGCFILLDADEGEQFPKNDMEFIEEMILDDEVYLHGVRMLGDCYGEEFYLTIVKGGESDAF